MSDSPSSHDHLSARAACEELFLDFHRLVDEGRAGEALALFADEPEPRFEVRGRVYAGTQALAGFLDARQRDTSRQTRHLASNFRFVLLDDDRARASANLTLFHRGGDSASGLALEAVVDCELEFVRTSTDEWRIASRRHSRFATAEH